MAYDCPSCKKQTCSRVRTDKLLNGLIIWQFHCQWCGYNYKDVSPYVRRQLDRQGKDGRRKK